MRIFLLSIALLVTACSSIDRRSEIANQKLQIGQALKTEVVDQIGLPNKVEKKQGKEFWLYSGKEARSDLFIPLPIAATPVGAGAHQVYYTDIGPSQTLDFEPILVCVFDDKGTLIEAFNPKDKEKNK